MRDSIFSVFLKLIDQKKKHEIALDLKLELDDQSHSFNEDFEKAINDNPKLRIAFEIENSNTFNHGLSMSVAELLRISAIEHHTIIEYVNNFLNYCKHVAQLQDIYDEYNKMYFAAEELKRKILDFKQKCKEELEKEEKGKGDHIHQINEIKRKEMERKIVEYMHQRIDFINNMTFQINSLRAESAQLKKNLKKAFYEGSASFSRKAVGLVDSSGNKFLADLPDDKNHRLCYDIFYTTNEIERKYVKEEASLRARLKQLQSERYLIAQNGHKISSGTNKMLTTQAQLSINPKSNEIAKVEMDLKSIEARKKSEIAQSIKSHGVRAGVNLNDEQVEIFQKSMLNSSEYNSLHIQSEMTHNKISDNVEMVKTMSNEIKKVVSDDIKLLESASNNQILSEDTRHSLEKHLSDVYNDFAESVGKKCEEADDLSYLKDFDEGDNGTVMRFAT